MSKKDEIKEKIAEYRFWRGIIVAAIIGIFGFIFTSYFKINKIIIILGSGLVLIMFFLTIAITLAIQKEIKDLRDEE